jgi:MFS family permease
MASFVATSENLGDVYGHKSLFMLGLLVFSAGLVVTALCHNVLTLLLGYGIVAGVGATPMVTLPWTLMNVSYQGRQREFALLSLSMALVTGSLVGPFLGGYLTTASDWRWAFVPHLVVVIVIWFLARPVEEIVKARDKAIDLAGGLLSFLGLAMILLGLNLTNEYGWWTAKKSIQLGELTIPPSPLSIVPTMIAVGLIIMVAFAFYWRRREGIKEKDQVWSFSLFKRRQFSVGLATSALYAVGTAGLMYTLYLFLQTALELTAFDTALAVSPYYIAMLLVVVTTFRLCRWLDRKYVIQIGLLTFLLGVVLLINSLAPTAGGTPMIPGLVVMGIGAGLVIGQMAELTLSATDFEERGEANGIYNALQDLGYSFGICIFGTGLIYLTSVELVDRVFKTLKVSVSDAERERAIAEFC